MQAIILAGGLGTRLRSVVSDRPKPMALVAGKPFLEYVLQGLKKSGIDDVIFAVGYKGGMVEEYFGDGSQFGIRARYAYEEELLGTAGAIKNAGNYVTDEQFFVLNGDTFYQMDFGDLSRIQQEKNLEMALVLRGVPDISRYGAARLTDGLLTAFNEKNGNTGAGTINGGVYLMKRALLDEIPEGYPEVPDYKAGDTAKYNKTGDKSDIGLDTGKMEAAVSENYYPDWSRTTHLDIRNVKNLILAQVILSTVHEDERPKYLVEGCRCLKEEIYDLD